MIKILQISIEVNSGSVGRIAEQIGGVVLDNGWSSYITYARNINPSKSKLIRIGNKIDIYKHGVSTRIFDNHCFSSKKATLNLIKNIDDIKPNIIHLHHLHGYFINIEILFTYLAKIDLPIVWTFHDCWSFTGHCAFFEYIDCNKWKTECYNCEQKKEYPKSILLDRSRQNFRDKKRIFNSVNNMTIVPVSNWLSDIVKDSFLYKYPVQVIQNGIDLNVFKIKTNKQVIERKFNVTNKFIILGVASTWDKRKGLDEFIKLNEIINKNEFIIILIGLSNSQKNKIPDSMIGISRTEDVEELADFYSASDVFFNPTFEDTFPTTNLESLACGTPVITYKTGGSVEAVSKKTGFVVEKGDVNKAFDCMNLIKERGSESYKDDCRERAKRKFDKNIKFNDYLELYKKLIR